MQRPKKAAESRERTVIKNSSKPTDSPKDLKYRSYPQVKSRKSPGVFESHKLGKVMKCVFCMKVINPKKSNVEEHLKTVDHRDAVSNLTIEGKIM
jgi:hypothetical protein